MKRLALILTVVIGFIAGCTTYRPMVTADMPDLTLSRATETRTTYGITADVILPPGKYRAMYQDDVGTFYVPERRIMVSGRPFDHVTVLVEDGKAVAMWLEGAKVIDRFKTAVELR